MKCEKRVMRGKFGPKIEDYKENEQNWVKSSSVICTIQEVLLGH